MKNIIFTVILLTALNPLFSQDLKKANQLFEKKAYINAAELYLKEANKSQEVLEKLGDCYYFNSQMNDAAKWYEKLITLHKTSIQPTYFFRYSQALKGIEKFDEADKWMMNYLKEASPDVTENNTLEYFQTLNNQIKRPFLVSKTAINTKDSEFGITFYKNYIVFASNRKQGKLYSWNNKPYLDLYKGELNNDGKVFNIQPFSEKINSPAHESNAVFTKDGKTMYFTRNSVKKGRKNKTNHLKIYRAQLINNEWTEIKELPFNNNNFSIEHPALSPDEKKLYFASDMPGTLGSFDLFYVTINDDGTYGVPKNLGSKINTKQREQFPFISSNNTLYFASNGHVGMGGLDIFKSEFVNNSFSTPTNLSTPINSNLDDFAFIINETSEKGYFASNRTGGLGDDDIYSFTKTPKRYLKGIVQDKNSLKLLPETSVSLFDRNKNLIAEQVVDKDASYSFEIYSNQSYILKGIKKLYIPSEIEFNTDAEGNINKDILLMLESYEDAEKIIAKEQGKTQIIINPIYFDFDKWNIRTDAAKELDNVVTILKKYPEMSIEIGAHTDNRGSDKYNKLLSEKRATSVKNYLIKNGVSSKAIIAIGYGESKPIKCTDNKNCTEADHDTNRRSEFVIIN